MKLVIGIDPGSMGGLAFILNRKIVKVIPMPLAGKEVDAYAISDMIDEYTNHDIVACIEKVGAMPGQGVTSMFNFGYVTGMMYGIMAGFNIPVHKVTPQAWKKLILAGTQQDKNAAIAFVRRAFPTVSLLASPKCKKYHDGMADAVCIALYAVRMRL